MKTYTLVLKGEEIISKAIQSYLANPLVQAEIRRLETEVERRREAERWDTTPAPVEIKRNFYICVNAMPSLMNCRACDKFSNECIRCKRNTLPDIWCVRTNKQQREISEIIVE